ncbi:MAG: hypothetical protein [Caudoviricetes sp.]|nr:MAG: hypothetical protein [Caudoviricetes sp.]
MNRSIRHVDRYTDIRQQTQADVERAEMWQRVLDRKARSQRIKERVVTWAVIGCLVVVVVRLFYVATA